jgi:ubiquinone/menaquinone biosynthesis C-methylase UbiE
MIRHFAAEAREAEFWGADISAEHILWANRHLRPPFRFVTTTTLPHLPFADCYFMIYAGSVFTHIADLAEAWLLEIRRVLAPGGRAYLTFHDSHTLNTAEHDVRPRTAGPTPRPVRRGVRAAGE